MKSRWTYAFLALVLVAMNTVADERLESQDKHWSFQPIKSQKIPPTHSHQVSNAIDAFVQSKLKAENIKPSPRADRTTLIRRVTLDLTGLPPSPEEVNEFIEDSRPGAYERLVDRLLASPHYGERWARPWMDLCHYADTDGYLTDQLRPVAWRYRAWLVDALNQNMPFDQFTLEQLAGDLLPTATIDQRIATGFLRQTLSDREGGADLEEFRVKQVVDRTEMVGTIWMGLTVGCARCHDHKYDPLSQREFFELYACLDNADEVNIDAPLPHERDPWLSSRDEYERKRREVIAPLKSEIDKLQKRWEAKCLYAWKNPGEDAFWDRRWELLGLVWGGGLGEGQLEGCEIMKLDWSRRTQRQKDDLLDFFLRTGAHSIDSKRAGELKLEELRKQLIELKNNSPKATRAPTIRASQTHRQTYIHERGEFRDRGEDVHPSTPSCVPRWSPGNENPRLALARWLVSGRHPLTARVVVNRMWQHFFGRGLVLTAEDFGTRGESPSHPRLLDWLSNEFVRTEWDVKAMHRLIVTSATYRQSSAPRPELKTRDPNNVLLSRQNSVRVSAETIRDIGLSASGLLYPKMGGPSVKPPQPDRVTMEAFGYNDWKTSPGRDRYRRGLYTFIIRTAPFAQAATFDSPNPNEICTRRIRSNTPLQALTLLNDPVFFEMAQAMADRVLKRDSTSDAARIDYAFQLCAARRPNAEEKRRLLVFLDRQRQRFEQNPVAAKKLISYEFSDETSPTRAAVWTNVCSVLLNLHEVITRD